MELLLVLCLLLLQNRVAALLRLLRASSALSLSLSLSLSLLLSQFSSLSFFGRSFGYSVLYALIPSSVGRSGTLYSTPLSLLRSATSLRMKTSHEFELRPPTKPSEARRAKRLRLPNQGAEQAERSEASEASSAKRGERGGFAFKTKPRQAERSEPQKPFAT